MTEQDEMDRNLEIGDRVEVCEIDPRDSDSGWIIDIEGQHALVAWDSGIRTLIRISDLTPI